MASREVTAEEKSKFGDKFEENLIAYDGIVIAVSKQIYDSGVTSSQGPGQKDILRRNQHLEGSVWPREMIL